MEKEKTPPPPINKHLQALIDKGIPVFQAEFHAAINNADNVPESFLSENSAKSNRQATMWWTQAGLVCNQKGFFFLVPEATVKYCHFK